MQKPVEKWLTQRSKRCKERKCRFLCFNKFLCWATIVLVAIVVWVTVIIFKWVTVTVCEMVSQAVGVVVGVARDLACLFGFSGQTGELDMGKAKELASICRRTYREPDVANFNQVNADLKIVDFFDVTRLHPTLTPSTLIPVRTQGGTCSSPSQTLG